MESVFFSLFRDSAGTPLVLRERVGVRDPEVEIRNPKHETRNKFKARSRKSETVDARSRFELSSLDLVLVSDFVLRASDFDPKRPASSISRRISQVVRRPAAPSSLASPAAAS